MESAVTDYIQECYDEAYDEARAEVAREIFKAIEKTVNDCVVGESLFKPAYFEFRKFNAHIAELKKKYTQPEPPKGN
jgi:hypothetical protein